jgi:hypothetical protein
MHRLNLATLPLTNCQEPKCGREMLKQLAYVGPDGVTRCMTCHHEEAGNHMADTLADVDAWLDLYGWGKTEIAERVKQALKWAEEA